MRANRFAAPPRLELHNPVLGGQTLAPDGGLKARNRGLGGGAVFGALGIDPDGGKSVHDGRGDHRIERERNAGDMCAERLRNRHGKGRRRIVALAERQTYHEILDHGPVSPELGVLRDLRLGRKPGLDPHQPDHVGRADPPYMVSLFLPAVISS